MSHLGQTGFSAPLSKHGKLINQEVNQSLVDDGLVDMDKIGAANFFWSFPSKTVVTRQNLVDSLKRDISKVRNSLYSFRGVQ